MCQSSQGKKANFNVCGLGKGVFRPCSIYSPVPALHSRNQRSSWGGGQTPRHASAILMMPTCFTRTYLCSPLVSPNFLLFQPPNPHRTILFNMYIPADNTHLSCN